jgi:ribosome-binding protein aMBF1 (putative translation factor)
MKNDIPRNEVLHKARLRAGLTQNQLALSVGVPEFVVTKLETKRRKLEDGLAQKLSEVLKVSVKQLEGGALV